MLKKNLSVNLIISSNIKLFICNFLQNLFHLETTSLFEDNGAIVDDDCELIINPTSTPNVVMPTGTPYTNVNSTMNVSREDFEERFDEEIEEYLCPINLVDEKEDIKVNPETYGTLALILVLIESFFHNYFL